MKVDFDELDFDPTCQVITVTAAHQGKPFTGIAFVNDEKFHEYGEYTYVNGRAHGRWFFINTENQQLVSEEFYENGVPIDKHHVWFQDGKLKEITSYQNGEIVFNQQWNKDGILIIEANHQQGDHKEWYDSGKIFRSIEKISPQGYGSIEKVFHEHGDLLMEIRSTQNNNDKQYFFNTDFFYEHHSLLNHYHYDVLSKYFQQILNKSKTPPAKFIKFLCELTAHIEPFFRYEAARILGELCEDKGIIFLEKIANDTTMPVLYDRNNSTKMSTAWSVGEMAQKSLQKIRQKIISNNKLGKFTPEF